MQLIVYLPFLFTGIFGLSAPVLVRRLPPAAGTWLLSGGGVLAATGCATALALLGFTLIGQTPLLAARGRWSDPTLKHADPVAAPIAALALATLVVLVLRVAATASRRLIALRDAYRVAASLATCSGELVVLDEQDHHAYAVPGHPGRIVVSTGLLRSLTATERRAMLAHERAHLVHRHHLHHTLAHLAAAANPLLARLPAAVALSTERWADETAAQTCRRETVADALTHAATRSPRRHPTPAVVLAAAVTEITARVQALRAPAARMTVWQLTIVLTLLAATAGAVLEAAHDTERLFELAQAAYRAAHP